MKGNLKFIYRKKTRHHDIMVAEQDDIRFLLTGHGKARKQSCVNINDRHKHMLNYSSLMFSSLVFVPEPGRVLVVGLGGGVVPRELVYYLPNVKVDAIEIDPEIVEVAKRFFFFEEGPRLKVRIGDGREILRRMPAEENNPYDIIMLDAFKGDYVPSHLMTTGFLELVRRMLSDTGVVAANMFNSHPLYPNQARTFMEVFGTQLYELRGTSAPGTTLIFAQGPAASPLNTDAAEPHPTSVASRLGLNFRLEIPMRLKLAPELIRAAVLTDKS